MGENSLAAVKELGKQLALRRHQKVDKLDTEKVIFFDVLGLFMVSQIVQCLPHSVDLTFPSCLEMRRAVFGVFNRKEGIHTVLYVDPQAFH